MHTPIAVGRLSGVVKISHNIDLTCSIIPDVIAKEDVYLDINGPIIRWHLLKFYGISQINDLTVSGQVLQHMLGTSTSLSRYTYV